METKRFAIVGTDARQAAAGRALARAGYTVVLLFWASALMRAIFSSVMGGTSCISS